MVCNVGKLKDQKMYVFMYIKYWVQTGQYVQYSQNN